MQTNIKKLPKSEVEIEGELDAVSFEGYFKKALEKISATLELPGFRKGKAPADMVLSKVPEMHILEEMAQMALDEHYPKILDEAKLDVIMRPEISILKLARNNPLLFKIKTAVLPEIHLPEYKEIAKKVLSEITEKDKSFEPTPEEIAKTILDIRRMRAPQEKDESGKAKEVPEANLPELNDEFVKGLGPFENVEDFHTKLSANIRVEKENQFHEKTRLKIMEAIVEKTNIDLPNILVEAELEKIMARMESDITQMGLVFEDYLKHLNKTKVEIRESFRKDAEKKALLALVLSKISEVENIKADEKELEHEVNHILEHYKDADPERVRIHAESVLVNEKVLKLLENQN